MRKLIHVVGGLAIGLTATTSSADILDANASVDAVRASVYGPLPELFELPTGQYDVGAVLRPEKDEDLLQIHLGGVLTGEFQAGEYRYAAGVGARAVYVGQDHDSGGALAVGGMAEFPIPELPDFGFSVYGYFAPEFTSLGELDEYLEFAPSVDYRLNPDTAVYLGYRYIRYDLGTRNDLTADDGVHIGIRLQF